MPSTTVENYLKCIYLQSVRAPHGRVAMGALAASMKVAPGTVTAMVKSLAQSGLVNYQPRTGVRLTGNGESLAVGVVRKHRLVELFLVEAFGMDWSEVHDEAEQLEHAISDRLLERIDEQLGRPAFDPHGDPIPPRKGTPVEKPLSSLADSTVGREVEVARVIDQGAAFLKFAKKHHLTPGRRVRVIAIDRAADAVLVETYGGRSVTIGSGAAAKVMVRGSTGERRA